MLPSSDMIEAGRRFASDLRRIRERRGISAEAVIARTKASPDILEAFESNALVDHPMYNRVYLRSFVRMVAEAIDIDPEVALEAAEELLEGRYRGSLAAHYLGEPAETPPAAEKKEEPSDLEPAAVDVLHAFEAADAGLADAWRGRLKWVVPGMVVIILIVLWLLRGSGEPAPPEPQRIPEPTPPDTTGIAVVPPRIVLPDTMAIWVVAAGDTLNPVRLRIDGDQRRPYWIEIGDSMMFAVTDRIAVEREMDVVALSVAGYRLPTGRFVEGEPITYTREEIQEALDSLRLAL